MLTGLINQTKKIKNTREHARKCSLGYVFLNVNQ